MSTDRPKDFTLLVTLDTRYEDAASFEVDARTAVDVGDENVAITIDGTKYHVEILGVQS
jgi:sarcosine oxidase gamma subunit